MLPGDFGTKREGFCVGCLLSIDLGEYDEGQEDGPKLNRFHDRYPTNIKFTRLSFQQI